MTFARTLFAIACHTVWVLLSCFLIADVFYSIIYQEWFAATTLGVTAIVVGGLLLGLSSLFGYVPECFASAPKICKMHRVFMLMTILLWMVPGLTVTHMYPDAEFAILQSGYTPESLFILRLFPGCYVQYVYTLATTNHGSVTSEMFYKIGMVFIGLFATLTSITSLGAERLRAPILEESADEE